MRLLFSLALTSILLALSAGCGGEPGSGVGEPHYTPVPTKNCLDKAGQVVDFDRSGQVLIPGSEGRIKSTLIGYSSSYRFVILFARGDRDATELLKIVNGAGGGGENEVLLRSNVVYWLEGDPPERVVASVTGCLT